MTFTATCSPTLSRVSRLSVQIVEGSVVTDTFIVRVIPNPDRDSAEVHIETENGYEPSFAAWMCATEYLMHLTAQKSNAGYEGALELLVKGAMTWRHKELSDDN